LPEKVSTDTCFLLLLLLLLVSSLIITNGDQVMMLSACKALGEGRRLRIVNEKMDVWSLGVCLFELAAGRGRLGTVKLRISSGQDPYVCCRDSCCCIDS
jgi:hypothetical protein